MTADVPNPVIYKCQTKELVFDDAGSHLESVPDKPDKLPRWWREAECAAGQKCVSTADDQGGAKCQA